MFKNELAIVTNNVVLENKYFVKIGVTVIHITNVSFLNCQNKCIPASR